MRAFPVSENWYHYTEYQSSAFVVSEKVILWTYADYVASRQKICTLCLRSMGKPFGFVIPVPAKDSSPNLPAAMQREIGGRAAYLRAVRLAGFFGIHQSLTGRDIYAAINMDTRLKPGC